MKNLLVFGLVAAVTVLMSCESAMATNKQKSSCKSYLILKNCCCNKYDHDWDDDYGSFDRPRPRKCHTICCFIYKEGDKEPKSYRDIKRKLVHIEPCSTHKVKLKEGKYLVFCVPAYLCEKLDNKSKFHDIDWIGAPTKIYVKCNKDQCYHVTEEGMHSTSGYGSGGSGGYGDHNDHDKCHCDKCENDHGGGYGGGGYGGGN